MHLSTERVADVFCIMLPIQEEFVEGYKDNEVVWLLVSLTLGQVQAFP